MRLVFRLTISCCAERHTPLAQLIALRGVAMACSRTAEAGVCQTAAAATLMPRGY
jgi:hypothetical protein